MHFPSPWGHKENCTVNWTAVDSKTCHSKILQAIKQTIWFSHVKAQFIVCTVQPFNLVGESLKNKAGTLIYPAISKDPFQCKRISLSTEARDTNEHIKMANLTFIQRSTSRRKCSWMRSRACLSHCTAFCQEFISKLTILQKKQWNEKIMIAHGLSGWADLHPENILKKW